MQRQRFGHGASEAAADGTSGAEYSGALCCALRVTCLVEFHEMKLEGAHKELPVGQGSFVSGAIEVSACSGAELTSRTETP